MSSRVETMTIDTDTRVRTQSTNSKRDAMKSYWGKYEETPTVESMMLNHNAGSIHLDDQTDILAVLPPLDGKRVLELGAGIGRFTGELAKTAGDLLTTDFIPSFIEENRRRHSHLPNVRYQVADALGLALPPESVDFVFTNWLLMYLGHHETVTFLHHCLTWLSPGGSMHLRESCSESSNKCKSKATSDNPTYYRHISQYINLLGRLRIPREGGGSFGFRVHWAKSVPTYIKAAKNWRQVHLIMEKVALADGTVSPLPALEAVVRDGRRQAELDVLLAKGLRLQDGVASPLEAWLLDQKVGMTLFPLPALEAVVRDGRRQAEVDVLLAKGLRLQDGVASPLEAWLLDQKVGMTLSLLPAMEAVVRDGRRQAEVDVLLAKGLRLQDGVASPLEAWLLDQKVGMTLSLLPAMEAVVRDGRRQAEVDVLLAKGLRLQDGVASPLEAWLLDQKVGMTLSLLPAMEAVVRDGRRQAEVDVLLAKGLRLQDGVASPLEAWLLDQKVGMTLSLLPAMEAVVRDGRRQAEVDVLLAKGLRLQDGVASPLEAWLLDQKVGMTLSASRPWRRW